MLGSCAVVGGDVVLKVSNPIDTARKGEIVEVKWRELRNAAVTPEQVVVYAEDGSQVPSQVLFDDMGKPISLIFQTDVPASGAAQYRVSREYPEEYESKVFGRYVPERMDDYAWENNLTTYRIYGPALKDPQTQGWGNNRRGGNNQGGNRMGPGGGGFPAADVVFAHAAGAAHTAGAHHPAGGGGPHPAAGRADSGLSGGAERHVHWG